MDHYSSSAKCGTSSLCAKHLEKSSPFQSYFKNREQNLKKYFNFVYLFLKLELYLIKLLELYCSIVIIFLNRLKI